MRERGGLAARVVGLVIGGLLACALVVLAACALVWALNLLAQSLAAVEAVAMGGA